MREQQKSNQVIIFTYGEYKPLDEVFRYYSQEISEIQTHNMQKLIEKQKQKDKYINGNKLLTKYIQKILKLCLPFISIV